jgi:uncharacterized membrane protein
MLSDRLGPGSPAALRVGTAGVAGLGTAFATGLNTQRAYAPAVGWITTAVVYLAWTWAVTWRMDAAATKDHALFHERDGTRHTAHVIVTIASMASLGGVAYLLWATSGDKPDLAAGIVGVLSVFASWFTIHTVYMLRYARLYYTAPDPQSPGIDYEGDPPTYVDFAYLAFTIGMCYSLSDNGVTSRTLRIAVLSQAMVSYLLGTIIIAITLNLVGGLAG